MQRSAYMSLKQLPRQEVERRIAAAQTIHLDLGSATTERIHKLVTDYSTSIGCPKEFFLLPLQSILAHFIGPKAFNKNSRCLERTNHSLEYCDGTQGAKEIACTWMLQ